MSQIHNVRVPHLWGIDAAYQIPRQLDAQKPTMILVNSFGTTSDLYEAQFRDESIAEKMNLIAIEPLGHGRTRAQAVENFTYWDTAIMNLQVMDALGIKKAFALGTSQGGLIVARMALLQPDRVSNGTSRDLKLMCSLEVPSDTGASAPGNKYGLRVSSLAPAWLLGWYQSW